MGIYQQRIGALILGVVLILIGLIVAGILDAQAAASGGASQIQSFAGAKPMNDLLPMLIRVVLVMIGVAMISIGGAGMMGYGRLAGR